MEAVRIPPRFSGPLPDLHWESDNSGRSFDLVSFFPFLASGNFKTHFATRPVHILMGISERLWNVSELLLAKVSHSRLQCLALDKADMRSLSPHN
jgi:hypothetical protein